MKPAQVLITAALGAALASPFQDLLGSPSVQVDLTNIPIDQMAQHRQVIDHLSHPRDFVLLKPGAPFTVPSDRLFVVTNLGLGEGHHDGIAGLSVNGEIEVGGIGNREGSTVPVIGRFVCRPGDIVEVVFCGEGSADSSSPRAWGFLIDP